MTSNNVHKACFQLTMKLKPLAILLLLILAVHTTHTMASSCSGQGVWLQVLGSGGPEIDDGRASSGYLVWQDGRARVLVDMGSGSLSRFEQSKAALNDLDIILLTHLHVDHSNDLPALIKGSFFTRRDRDLPIYGPTGNHLMPSMTAFIEGLFGEKGAFRYLKDYVDGSGRYRIVSGNVATGAKRVSGVLEKDGIKVSAISVDHGPIPALAWRLDIDGSSVVFSGDISNKKNSLWRLAQQADVLVAHHAIAEHANPVARNLHMPPSEIGKIAGRAGVKALVLSHRMKRTLGKETESLAIIREHYQGPVTFADDLQCFDLLQDK